LDSTIMIATVQQSSQQRFVFRDADWRMYKELLQILGERPVRLTYDRGRLELMTLSFGHERSSGLLGRFVEVLTEELNIPLNSSGSTTLNREDLDRGLEGDQSYYLDNEERVRNKEEIDLNVDPPPDLAIEVDVSRSSLNRMSIYVALKVPEVWRYDGEELQAYLLGPDGKYAVSPTSRHFPFLRMVEVVAFLQMRTEMSDTSLVRAFREWVRNQQAIGWPKG
jgi:Uma2 family endonuclease